MKKAIDCKIFTEVNNYDVMNIIHYINKMLSKFRGLIVKTSHEFNEIGWPYEYYFDKRRGAIKVDYDDNDVPLFDKNDYALSELSWKFSSNTVRVHILFKPNDLSIDKIELKVFVKFLKNRLNIITPEMCDVVKTVL